MNVTLILKFVTVATVQGIYPQTVAYLLLDPTSCISVPIFAFHV